MDIVARLREEREALVERLAQVDKMLKEHDEWGREAQRLLSLTPAPEVRQHDAATDVFGPSTIDEATGSEAGEPKRSSMFRKRTFPVQTRVKTPMPEFEAAVIDVLRNAERPMDRTELYDALTARGIVIGSGTRDADLNALSARVYRMAKDPQNQITSERGQGYRIVLEEENDDEAAQEPESGTGYGF